MSFKLNKALKPVLSIALASTIFFGLSGGGLASDWVEEGVSEIQPGRQNMPADSERDPVIQQRSLEPDQEKKYSVFEQPDQNSKVEIKGNTTDPSKPLEASVSTIKRDPRRQARFPGLDNYALNILRSAPSFPPANKDVAVNNEAFKLWLNNTHPGITDSINRDQIIEIKGKWDDSDHILRAFGFPHKRITDRQLEEVDLSKVLVIVVNCPGEVSRDATLLIRKFVKNGGYLLTTDWALHGVLEQAIPGYVLAHGESLNSAVVDAVVVDPDPNLFKGIPPVAHWKLVNKCQFVEVRRPGPVRVLIRSRTFSRFDPQNFGILAFTIDFEEGKVLHLVGHFDNNVDRAFNNALSDPAPGIKISMRQALAANFIVEAIKRRKN